MYLLFFPQKDSLNIIFYILLQDSEEKASQQLWGTDIYQNFLVLQVAHSSLDSMVSGTL